MAKNKGDSPIEDMEAIVKAVERDADGIRTVVFNTVKGQLTRRVHNEGTATSGSRIGAYKPATKKIRQELGLRIDKVDLEVSGTLRRAEMVGVSEGRVVLGIAEQKEPVSRIKTGDKKKEVKGLGTISNVGATGRSRRETLSADAVSFHEVSEITTVENAILQEKRFNTEIFAPSKEEIKRGETTLVKELDRTVLKALG